MIKLKLSITKIISLVAALSMSFTLISAAFAQEPNPTSWQQTATGMKRSQWGYTAGLGMIARSEGSWPALSLRGGVTNYGDIIYGPVGIPLGSVTVPGVSTASLLSETVDWAHNELTFSYGASSQLKLWVSRLSPAVLVNSPSNSLRLFTGNPAQSSPKYAAFPTGQGIQIQSLSTTNTSLANLNGNWLLLWYGNNSHFLETKRPLSYDNLPSSDGYQADAPLLVTFQNLPTALKKASGGGVELSFAGTAGYLSILPLLGRNHPRATETETWKNGLPSAIQQKADWWAGRRCSYPAGSSETYAYDQATDTVTITENISFLSVCGTGTSFAPIPPFLGLARESMGVTFSGSIVDANLPTEFGPTLGIENTSQYSWSVQGLANYTNTRRHLNNGQVPQELQQELANQVQKIISAGHFAPWIFMDDSPINVNRGDLYWGNPADILYHLVEIADALPDGSLKTNLINYLKSERSTYPPEDVHDLELNPNNGAGTIRQNFSYYGSQWEWYWIVDPVGGPDDRRRDVHFIDVPLYNLYALSRYYDITGEALPANLLGKAKTVLDRDMQEQDWAIFYWFYGHQDRKIAVVNANRHLAGLIGFIRLAKKAGDQQAEYLGRSLFAKAAILRVAMSKYPRYLYSAELVELPSQPDWQPRYLAGQWRGYIFNYDWTDAYDDPRQVTVLDQHEIYLYDHSGVMRSDYDPYDFVQLTSAHLTGYQDMVPELGRLLGDHVRADAEIYANKVEAYQPNWYAAFAEATLGMEHNLSHPVDSFQIFMAKAWIQQESPDKLAVYTDIPWLEAGDLFYVHKLAETIKAYRGYTWVPE